MDEFQVRFTEKAQTDLNRLYEFLLEFDIHTAERALQASENWSEFFAPIAFFVSQSSRWSAWPSAQRAHHFVWCDRVSGTFRN